MTRMVRYAAVLATSSVVWLCASASLAAEPACLPVPAETDRLVNARWPNLPGRISGALERRNDVDGCARIAIRLDPRPNVAMAILLEVVLRDGRTASRSVARVEDVIPTLEALLLLPEAGASPPAIEAIPAPAEPARVPASSLAHNSATVVFATVEPATPAVPRRRFGIEFSLAAGARVGDGQTGVGLGALTFFDIRGWLLGFEGAADDYQSIEGGPGATVLKLAVLAGRRFRLGGTALDLTVGPAVAMNGLGKKVAVKAGSDAGASSAPPESDGLHKRLVCGARLIFRPASVVRTFIGVDGEVALESSPAVLSPAEPRLPGWTAGVVVGATVGTP